MEKFPWWNEAQKALADEVDAFSDEITPKVQELVWKREFPWEIIREVGKRGWFGAVIPEEYGGKKSEWGYTGCCIILEYLSRAGVSVACPYLLTMCGGTHQIEDFSPPEKKEEWLPKIAKGELLGAVGLTEPYVGSDAASVETVARREGDEYVITGKKRFITSGLAADIYVVYARTSDDPKDIAKYRHITAFIVERGREGFHVEKVNELIGFDNLYNAYLDLDEVRVPVENRLGEEGEGWRVMMSGLNFERTMAAASMLGVMREALRYAVFHSERRIQFGQPTINIGVNQFKIADMVWIFNTARLLTYYTAYVLDLGGTAAAEAATAKMFTTDFGMKMFLDAVQVMGGDGVTRFYPVESYIRDTKILQIAAGTNEIMKLLIFNQGLRALRKYIPPPVRKVHPELRVPITVAFGSLRDEEKKKVESEEDVLKALAENYKVNPGLAMTLDDMKGVLAADDETLIKMLTALEEKKLVKTFKDRKGRIKLARITLEGLRKTLTLEECKWIPSWVLEKDIF